MARFYKFVRATGNSVYFTPNPTGVTLPGWANAKWRRVSSVEDKKLSAEAKAKMSAQGYYRQPWAYKQKRKRNRGRDLLRLPTIERRRVRQLLASAIVWPY